MKCEEVIELFPELMDDASMYPETVQHLEQCDTCRGEFEIFKLFISENTASIPEVSTADSRRNREAIFQKSKKYHIRTLTMRFASAAALVAVVLISILTYGGSQYTIDDIPDYVLAEAAEANVLPEMQASEDDMIEYLAYHADLNSVSGLY